MLVSLKSSFRIIRTVRERAGGMSCPARGGEEDMVQQLQREIPAERRWDIATRCADLLPFAYGQAFREIAPEQQRELSRAEKEIWREVGRKQSDIAKYLQLPTTSAVEIAETMSEISRTVLGPRMQVRVIQEKGDSATAITEQCPMAANIKKFDADARSTCELCHNYVTAAVESLNPNYQITSDRHMCMGDSSCRMTIEKIQK